MQQQEARPSHHSMRERLTAGRGAASSSRSLRPRLMIQRSTSPPPAHAHHHHHRNIFDVLQRDAFPIEPSASRAHRASPTQASRRHRSMSVDLFHPLTFILNTVTVNGEFLLAPPPMRAPRIAFHQPETPNREEGFARLFARFLQAIGDPMDEDDEEAKRAKRVRIDALPEVTFAPPKAPGRYNLRSSAKYEAKADGSGDTCGICLEAFVVGVKMRMLPCVHRFHVECVDKWLMIKLACPNCRQEI